MKRLNQKKYFPYGHQWIDDSDIKEVVKVLKSDFITQGPKVEKFENLISQYTRAKYCVAVSSGTAALHLASLAIGIKHNDEVITSPLSFIATSNCIIYAGGFPKFVDINNESFNIDPLQIKNYLENQRKNVVKGIIPVHFAGLPCEIEIISKIAKKYNLFIIEDACHAFGAEWKDSSGKWQKVGSCSHSDMTVFSFHPVKHITTGEGGAITTNNIELYKKLLSLRNHGIIKNPEEYINIASAYSKSPISNDKFLNTWYYEMQNLGFNYRITDFQCVLGISQLKKINKFIEARQNISKNYTKILKNLDTLKFQKKYPQFKNAYHLFILLIDFEKQKISKPQFIDLLRKKGIGTQVHYIPIYRHPFYQKILNISPKGFPNAENYYKQAISIPIYASLLLKDSDYIAKNIKIILSENLI